MKLFGVKLKVVVVWGVIIVLGMLFIEKVNALEYLADQVGNCEFSERCR